MQKIRLIVHSYEQFSKHTQHHKYDFDCINTNLSKLQEFTTGHKRQNWNDGNKVQWDRLISTGNVELISYEQMYSIEDEIDKYPTFYLVTVPEIGGMFDTGWIYWLPKNTLNFLKSTGIPILLSQPGEFGFEWIDSNDKFAWLSHVFIYFMNKLRSEGLSNKIIIHNMSKLFMGLEDREMFCESVYSRQWIEHVKIKENLSSGTITYEQHLENFDNKKLFFSSNRAPREARCLLLLSLLKHNHLDLGHMSFLCEAPATNKLSKEEIAGYFKAFRLFSEPYTSSDDYQNYYDSVVDMLPIELDVNVDSRNKHVILNDDINHFRLNALFEIVVETHDFSKEPVQAGVLSEKVFWPMLNQMPFILMGHRRNIDLLHELGFETFEKDFNVSMLNDSDIFVQADCVNRAIAKFNNYSKQHRLDWLKLDSVKNKILHNYNHLISTDWNNNEIENLGAAFNSIMFKR